VSREIIKKKRFSKGVAKYSNLIWVNIDVSFKIGPKTTRKSSEIGPPAQMKPLIACLAAHILHSSSNPLTSFTLRSNPSISGPTLTASSLTTAPSPFLSLTVSDVRTKDATPRVCECCTLMWVVSVTSCTIFPGGTSGEGFRTDLAGGSSGRPTANTIFSLLTSSLIALSYSHQGE
jgi:hypothetical protein